MSLPEKNSSQEKKNKTLENKGARDYRKAFGQFSSNRTQRPNTLKPTEVELDSQEDVAGEVHTIDFDKGDIVMKQSGMYLFIAGPQIGKVRGTTPRWIDFWVRVNNIDVPNSNIRAVLQDPQEKTVVPMNIVLPLNRGDTLNIMIGHGNNRRRYRTRSNRTRWRTYNSKHNCNSSTVGLNYT